MPFQHVTLSQLLDDGKAFVEFVLAFILALGFQLAHKPTCDGGSLTHHSHYARIRLGDLTIWRIQCTSCKAVFTVLPHFVLRYRHMSPDVARDALLATHGGLSLQWCATICHISPMALYRLICTLGHHSLVSVLLKCRSPLPVYILADEKHSRCLTDRVYLPTIVSGRVIWHLGASDSKSAAAFTLFAGARLGFCLLHALNKLPDKLSGIPASVRRGLRAKFHALLHRCRQRKSLRVVALGQRLRHFANRIDTAVGEEHGECLRHWFETKKAGWYAVLEDPKMPAMSTVLEQAHNAMDRYARPGDRKNKAAFLPRAAAAAPVPAARRPEHYRPGQNDGRQGAGGRHRRVAYLLVTDNVSSWVSPRVP